MVPGAQKAKLFASLLLLELPNLTHASVPAVAYEADIGNTDAGLSLLQISSKPTVAESLNEGPQIPEAGFARASLPRPVFETGMQLLHKEDVLDAVVYNTRIEAVYPYANEPVTYRIPSQDHVDSEDAYGLDTLSEMAEKKPGMMNMIDIGGNLGKVSIAAFKKFPGRMRIIVVEPVPSTFFLLKWNLWLNSIPELTPEQFQSSPEQAGILALNNGMSSVEDTVGLCWTPPWTMGSHVCNCSVQEQTDLPQHGVKQCLPMVTRTVDSLLSMFGDQTIDLFKIDCEGCERDVIPSLMKLPGNRIGKFVGELHEVSNELEDFACKFEEGNWFRHVCWTEGGGCKGACKGYGALHLKDRCQKGQNRVSCIREWLLPANEEPATANLFELAGRGV